MYIKTVACTTAAAEYMRCEPASTTLDVLMHALKPMWN